MRHKIKRVGRVAVSQALGSVLYCLCLILVIGQPMEAAAFKPQIINLSTMNNSRLFVELKGLQENTVLKSREAFPRVLVKIGEVQNKKVARDDAGSRESEKSKGRYTVWRYLRGERPMYRHGFWFRGHGIWWAVGLFSGIAVIMILFLRKNKSEQKSLRRSDNEGSGH